MLQFEYLNRLFYELPTYLYNIYIIYFAVLLKIVYTNAIIKYGEMLIILYSITWSLSLMSAAYFDDILGGFQIFMYIFSSEYIEGSSFLPFTMYLIIHNISFGIKNTYIIFCIFQLIIHEYYIHYYKITIHIWFCISILQKNYKNCLNLEWEDELI